MKVLQPAVGLLLSLPGGFMGRAHITVSNEEKKEEEEEEKR